MSRLSSSPTSRTDHGDTLREGAACGAGPGAAGCHQWARPWLCWGAPAAPHCWGGAAGPQETSCPRLGAPHPVFTVLCAHPGLRQPRPSPDSRGASGEGLGVRGLHKDPPRQPGPAPRAGQGPAPHHHPAPAPHSRCLAPHQFQAWGPSHGAGAPPGHTTWPTSSSLATSTLTEPLTQPRPGPAATVLQPRIVCCSPCRAPRSPSTPAPLTVLSLSAGSAAAGLPGAALSPRAGAQGQQQQLPGADSPQWQP